MDLGGRNMELDMHLARRCMHQVQPHLTARDTIDISRMDGIQTFFFFRKVKY